MALIECPFCHKSISNTVKKCIHCGKEWDEARKMLLRDYRSVLLPEREALEKEFKDTHEGSRRFEYGKQNLRSCKWHCFFALLAWGACMLVIVFLSSKGIYVNDEKHKALANATVYLMVLPPVLSVAGFIFFDIYHGTYEIVHAKRKVVYLRKYQDWLEREKGIVCDVSFWKLNDRERVLFENVDLDMHGF